MTSGPDSLSRCSRSFLDDDAFVFCSHLQMSLVCRKGITGLTAHPCDFYEITAALAPTGETK